MPITVHIKTKIVPLTIIGVHLQKTVVTVEQWWHQLHVVRHQHKETTA